MLSVVDAALFRS